eukprot:CAMPEP_0203924552 /NCGR_PEP_ID=MMETSP0359-20131031/64295_1 /ASSEMBLY_ACC=CAM_ASM_000338 /TAXON_ID=268821 /ORGANISM="Scrippsiella Hangoei, Strain SHTV-5" /LENGTH=331 /DNA_ID=CAMNT_0050852807 /DNA_START=140 /DNA_END=1132 /DNA_ORIENTATION=-
MGSIRACPDLEATPTPQPAICKAAPSQPVISMTSSEHPHASGIEHAGTCPKLVMCKPHPSRHPPRLLRPPVSAPPAHNPSASLGAAEAVGQLRDALQAQGSSDAQHRGEVCKIVWRSHLHGIGCSAAQQHVSPPGVVEQLLDVRQQHPPPPRVPQCGRELHLENATALEQHVDVLAFQHEGQPLVKRQGDHVAITVLAYCTPSVGSKRSHGHKMVGWLQLRGLVRHGDLGGIRDIQGQAPQLQKRFELRVQAQARRQVPAEGPELLGGPAQLARGDRALVPPEVRELGAVQCDGVGDPRVAEANRDVDQTLRPLRVPSHVDVQKHRKTSAA